VEDIALQFVSGLLKAMFLFLLASGLSLIFGVSRILNIMH
jgi:branched-chain amino acid transport system permease protein